MRSGKYFLMALFMVVLLSGCSRNKQLSPAEQASGDPAYRETKDLCEQEALGRCWKQIDSSPLWLNEIREGYKQKKCRKEWFSFCMDKHGYPIQK